MSCQHHPEYDPVSGEPTAPMRYQAGDSCVQIPCPYCWQARAEHVELNHKILAALNKKLENQLVELANLSEYSSSLRNYQTHTEKLEKREAVLREALEWIKGRVEPYSHDLRSGHYTIATDIKEKARAALGE